MNEPNTLFEQRKAGIGCPMCPDAGTEDVVVELPSGKVHLKNNAAYRGYCVLVFRRHAVELHELTTEERVQWIEDMAHIGGAIEATCHPAKLNTAMLGNLVPHLHCHLMPRYTTDPEWGQPPTFAPDVHPSLSPEDYAQLRQELHARLNSGVPSPLN